MQHCLLGKHHKSYANFYYSNWFDLIRSQNHNLLLWVEHVNCYTTESLNSKKWKTLITCSCKIRIYRINKLKNELCTMWVLVTRVHTKDKGAMVFNATLNNISVILWRSALLVEETVVLGKKPPTCCKSLTVVSSTPHHERDSNSQREWW